MCTPVASGSNVSFILSSAVFRDTRVPRSEEGQKRGTMTGLCGTRETNEGNMGERGWGVLGI